MKGRFRVPMYVVAAALLGLIVLLATLQYRWLGQVSAAERERMKANLATRAEGFAQDFDREITRAYLTFQVDPVHEQENLASRLASLHDRWQATSRYPRLVKDVYLVPQSVDNGPMKLQRFNATTRFVEPVEWPASLAPLQKQLAVLTESSGPASPLAGGTTMVIRSMPGVVWESVPALVIPMPLLLVNRVVTGTTLPQLRQDLRTAPSLAYTVLELDKEYVSAEMLPALARQHFNASTEGVDYEMAVVSTSAKTPVYTTASSFTPDPSDAMDASAELFQVRLQEFPSMASEVRRFTSFTARIDSPRRDPNARPEEIRQTLKPQTTGTYVMRDSAPVSIMLQQNSPLDTKAIEAGITAATRSTVNPPKWRLMIKHPSGSLEAAVSSVRRRNLLVSSGILGILGVSIGFLVVSTRRAQDLARQQMEFVAAVSHELRTPLAVIRSAADNLADGVVYDHPQVRKYGDLVRGEGRRLTEMVEQILELAGIQSGQRGFALTPIQVPLLLRHVVHASSTLIEQAGLEVEYDIAEALPPVLGDEQGLKRVFQNLIGNAIKYGASGGWIGISARASGREVLITVADRGMGIEAAEQANIFDPFYRTPDVIAAQIQGAGLGLSLVQRIVEAHGGRITVRSAPGTGSEFTVHLPSATEQPATRSSAATDAARTSA